MNADVNKEKHGHVETPSVWVRELTPQNTRVFEGTYSLLHCQVEGDELYRGVFCVLLFPISHPYNYISLRYTDENDKIREIGIIEHLDAFREKEQELIHASLSRHYYEQTIMRIYSVRNEFGVLVFDVETNRGPRQFMMPWRIDRAEDYGTEGKVLLDALDNRFIVPDVSSLPAPDRRRFTSYIYW